VPKKNTTAAISNAPGKNKDSGRAIGKNRKNDTSTARWSDEILAQSTM